MNAVFGFVGNMAWGIVSIFYGFPDYQLPTSIAVSVGDYICVIAGTFVITYGVLRVVSRVLR